LFSNGRRELLFRPAYGSSGITAIAAHDKSVVFADSAGNIGGWTKEGVLRWEHCRVSPTARVDHLCLSYGMFCTATSDNRVAIWEWPTGQLTAALPPQKQQTMQIRVMGDGLALRNSAGECHLIDVDQARERRRQGKSARTAQLRTSPQPILAVDASSTSKALAMRLSPHNPGELQETLLPLDRKLHFVPAKAHAVRFANSGRIVAAAEPKRLALYTPGPGETLDEVKSFDLPLADAPQWIWFTPDDSRVYVGAKDKFHVVDVPETWHNDDVSSGGRASFDFAERMRACAARAGEVRAVCCAADGSIAVANAAGEVRLWPAELDEEHALAAPGPIMAMAFSCEGEEFAIAESRAIHFWDKLSGEPAGSLPIPLQQAGMAALGWDSVPLAGPDATVVAQELLARGRAPLVAERSPFFSLSFSTRDDFLIYSNYQSTAVRGPWQSK
jgi:hypothetical protein